MGRTATLVPTVKTTKGSDGKSSKDSGKSSKDSGKASHDGTPSGKGSGEGKKRKMFEVTEGDGEQPEDETALDGADDGSYWTLRGGMHLWKFLNVWILQ